MIEFKHTPVLLNECLDSLNIKSNGIYVDGTFGGGGHSSEILKRLTTGKLIGIDKDQVAISNAKEKFSKNENLILVHNDFKNYVKILNELGITKVDGILLDLGVSSYQLDTENRGFSYRFDSDLDMRMDQSQSLTAKFVVNNYTKAELEKILFTYGEEPYAKKIVAEIIKQREIKEISTTKELVDIIEKVVPKKFGNRSVSTKTFQAIRIEVNKELEGLYDVLMQMIDSLNIGGRLAVITFHSLEDRIVKSVFKLRSTDCICDKSSPICICNHKAEVKNITKKPITASELELEDNKRSSSAKLRVVEKIL